LCAGNRGSWSRASTSPRYNWIDYKDSRYCEGCDLGVEARKLNYRPGGGATAAGAR